MSRRTHFDAARWMPGIAVLRRYERGWLAKDLQAGVALTMVLVPVGMSYAQAAGLPVATGLYASVAALVGYALFGPSPVMILGPDSALAALIAAAVGPLALGDPARAASLSALLACLAGVLCVAAGLSRLSGVTDLLSKPIQYGYLNGIAITLIANQIPALLGFRREGGTFVADVTAIAAGVSSGATNGYALAIGAGCLGCIALLRRFAPAWPGALVGVGIASAAAWGVGASGTPLPEIGTLPQGIPAPALPSVSLADVASLAAAALALAVVASADISILSRAIAPDRGRGIDRNQELVALGIANLFAGALGGCAVTSSSSRTPVALAAGARTQLTGLVGAACIVALLAMPTLLRHVPNAALAAVVIHAAAGIVDVRAIARLYRLRRGEFAVSLLCFCGIVLAGVVPGMLLAVGVSLLSFVRRAWHPYDAVLGRVAGRRGYHDVSRHPDARQIPGLVLFRWDAPLFYANAEIFRERLYRAIDAARDPVHCIAVAAEPITDIDITAADMLAALRAELAARHVALQFAELKGPVKDRLRAYGLFDAFGAENFFPTVTDAVSQYVSTRRRQSERL